MKPLIGITGRRLESSVLANMDARFSRAEFDFFFADYARCVHVAGGVPVHLPFEAASFDCVEHLDGLIISGGQDVHHTRSGGPTPAADRLINPRLDRNAPDEQRDDYEMALIAAAMDRGIAVLGICRGHQILNVALGGTLIHDLRPDEIVHLSTAHAPCNDDHDVMLDAGSTIRGIYGEIVRVNSWHHQAVDVCAPSLRVVGRAPDGVVEAIEMPGHPVLGVQWHPEWHPKPDPVFDWLVDAAVVTR